MCRYDTGAYVRHSSTRPTVFHGAGVRRRSVAATGLALCLALLVGACTSNASTAELPDGEEPVRQVTVGAKNAWTGADLGIDEADPVVFRENAALMHGRSGGRLAVAEAETGEARWVRDRGEPLERSTSGTRGATVLSRDHGGWLGHDGQLLTVGKGKDWAVIAPYELARKNEGPQVSGHVFFDPAEDDDSDASGGPEAKGRFRALDSRGREIGDELPGQPLVLGKDRVLLRQNDSASEYPLPSQTVRFYPRG